MDVDVDVNVVEFRQPSTELDAIGRTKSHAKPSRKIQVFLLWQRFQMPLQDIL